MKHLLDIIEDFIRGYFDKLLLVGILLLLISIGDLSNGESVKNWAMGQANTVIGAIIMLTTGKAISRLNGNGGSKPNVSEDKRPDGAE